MWMPIAIALAAMLAACEPQRDAAGVACEELARLALPDTTVTLAQEVRAGSFDPGPPPEPLDPASFEEMPAFCRVAATLTPATGSEIKMEIWMPSRRWTGRLVVVGNGGFAGYLFYPDMAPHLARGYAVAATNTGHDGLAADASFAAGSPEKIVDFAYRAAHLTAVTAKAVIAAHKGAEANFSAFVGCSTGGRQGLEAVQRYPEDFDLVVAGAPANDMARLQAYSLMLQQAMAENPQLASRLPLIHDAAVATCDADDGVADGVIGDPLRCDFDPDDLVCRGGDDACLTAREAAAAARVYAGPTNPRTGALIYPGALPGSELEWAGFSQVETIGSTFYRHMVMGDPQWDSSTFDFDRDVERGLAVGDGILQSTSPDISSFVERGGKLLLWHGWTDGYVSPRNTIAYYERVVETLGPDAAESVRLFMMPGVDHCGGGEGPMPSDFPRDLERLVDWVRGGDAPDQLLARRPLGGGRAIERPLCPYPQIARYDGTGDPSAVDSFACAAESP